MPILISKIWNKFNVNGYRLTVFVITVIIHFSLLANNIKNVFFLNSYHKGLEWSDNLSNTLFKELTAHSSAEVKVFVEYMDAKRFDDTINLNSFSKYILKKYNNISFDLIISADDPAYDFLVENQQNFIKNTPVAFCGISYHDTIIPNSTGIIEDIEIYSNIKTILKIHPNYNKLYFLVDNSITGNLIYEHSKKILPDSFPNLRFEYLRNYTHKELKLKLLELRPDDIIFLTLFNTDRNKKVVSHDEILEVLRIHCNNTPVYGAWDFYMNKGVVIGGKITSGILHGEEISDIALKILGGKSPKEIPIKVGSTKYVFDQKLLNKFNIHKKKLPEHSEIINAPGNIIKQYKKVAITLLVLFILLVIVIILLVTILRKERQYLSIIELKQQELKIALKEAQVANEVQRSFLSNISHEIRTPMNGILGFAELLEASDVCTKPDVFDYVQHIKRNGTQLMNIINDIIEMSKAENNILDVNYVPIKINLLLDSLQERYEIKVNDINGLDLIVNKQYPDEDITIITDLNKLQQIFKNLIDNAIKFTSKGKIELTYQLHENKIEFCVSDTGIGINKENIEVIFKNFGQVEKGFSRNYQGAGLGLSITKAYVNKLGGNIWVESEPKSGSKFYFTLPIT